MRQISGRMSGTEIELEMEIQSLRVRVAALDETVRALQQRLSRLEQSLGAEGSRGSEGLHGAGTGATAAGLEANHEGRDSAVVAAR